MFFLKKKHLPLFGLNYTSPLFLIYTYLFIFHKLREKNLAALVPEALKIRSECGCYRLPNDDPYLNFEKFLAAMKQQAQNEKSVKQRPRVIIMKG